MLDSEDCLIGFSLAVLYGRWGRPGIALVKMSVVEQHYRVVLAVQRGEPKIVVATQFGVSRRTLHSWWTATSGTDWLG
jgi:hypothetical protein